MSFQIQTWHEKKTRNDNFMPKFVFSDGAIHKT